MRTRALQLGLALSCGLLAVSAQAATAEKPADKPFADADHVAYTFPSGSLKWLAKATSMVNHGGGVIASPKVVFIFWGPSFKSGGADNSYATTLQVYRNQLGSTGEWAVLQQYGIMAPVSLGAGSPDWFDSSTPPTNVTDATVQAEVNRYLASHAFDNSTVYEVVIPSTSYSSSGTSTSCGGPALSYCGYHGYYSGTSGTVKYSIQPYPGCAGCKVSGWSNAQNQEHFVHHDTCNAVTDPTFSSWYDSSGYEVCDMCAWSPTPILSGGYGYQYTWSSSAARCVLTR